MKYQQEMLDKLGSMWQGLSNKPCVMKPTEIATDRGFDDEDDLQ